MTVKAKSALVTGCSEGGLGYSIAKEFQSRGVHVFATARTPSKVAGLASLPNVTVLALDVTSDASIQEAVKAVEQQTGGRLDYLVNNAGNQYVMPTLDMDIEVAKQMYDVNVWGVFSVIKAFAPLVIEAKGTIANLASISGLVRPPFMGKSVARVHRQLFTAKHPVLGVYAGSKSAAEAMSEALRHELKPFGVKVLTVIVGAIKTNIFTNGPGYELPKGSRYEPARKEIAARISGHDVESRLGSPEDFARNLVGDIVRGASGTIGRGPMSSFIRFATAIFPSFILVSRSEYRAE